jgi:1-deoxy-D-xylulose-5-phosphate reductoisomerase
MNFHFHEFDERRFPCVSYAKEAMKHGGTMPTVLNASNEEAVYAFLNKEISFLSIEVIIKRCMDSHRVIDNPTIEDIVYVDQLVRQQVKKLIKEGKF